jgi:hypothetical protein
MSARETLLWCRFYQKHCRKRNRRLDAGTYTLCNLDAILYAILKLLILEVSSSK